VQCVDGPGECIQLRLRRVLSSLWPIVLHLVHIGQRGVALPNCSVDDCRRSEETFLGSDLSFPIVHQFVGDKPCSCFS
jgi:hypothetical protein